MSKVTIEAVKSRSQQKQFLNLPWKLYRNDPNWVPPIRSSQKELAGFARHPFYLDAQAQTFLAWKDGQLCGRIAAINNRAHNRYQKDQQRGFLGFFESTDDQSVADALFDAARQWLTEQGQPILRGPVNPSLNYECGLLVEGFDRPPTFMMPYNHSYYGKLWEGYGFQKSQDLFTYCGDPSSLAKIQEKTFFVRDEVMRRFHVTTRSLRPRHFLKDVRTFLEIYNKSLVGTWGFVPMSEAEIETLSGGLRFLIVPRLTCIAEVEGKAVGAIFGLLDYNPRIKQIDGRLFPFGFLRILFGRRSLKRIRMVSTNVLPEYQRWGLGVVLGTFLIEPGLNWGCTIGEFSWVLESNHLSRKTLERAGSWREKTHRIYDLE